MTNFIRELRYALRRLAKSPGFTLTAILTLALGIGATTSIFSVVEAVLLRPLPFRDPGQLVLIKENVNKLRNLMDLPAPDVLTFEQGSRAFGQVGGFETGSMELSGAGEPVRLATARLTAGVFAVLGVNPVLGRTFTRQEDDQSQKVAMISYDLWKSRFQGDPKVLGRSIDLERNPHIIIGVMPRDFEFPLLPGKLSQAQLWVPMSFTPQERADAGDNFQYGAVARLKPGMTLAQAGEDANRVAKQITADYPASMGVTVTASLVPLKDFTIAEARPLVRVLFAAVAVVLLIACANLAGLLLVRGVRKRREVAVRRALGARSLALVEHSLMESLVIGLGGGVLGVFLAWSGLRWFVSLLPETLPRISEITLNGPVLAFALFVTLGTSLLCGLAPALAAMRTSVNEGLRDGGRAASLGSWAQSRIRSALVVTEIAGALVLLTAAGLLLRSFGRMRAVDPGFEPDHLLTASFDLPRERYQTQQQVNNFHEELLRRLRQLPGVKSAALASSLPMAEPTSDRFFVADGYHPPQGAAYSSEAQAYVVGDYLRTMEIPLLRGRYLADSDTADSPLAVVVSRTLAERYWPGQDPIGKRIKWGVDANSRLPWMTVVGEVADTKQGALDSRNWNQVYQPLLQFPASWGDAAEKLGVHGQNMRIALRTAGDPKLVGNAIERTVWSLDPQLAVSHLRTMEEAISESEAPRRFNTTVLSAFALGAVLLAVLGIYGVIAFSVAQRTQEIAVRMALGAQPARVLRLVLSSGAKLAGLGCVIGLAGAAAVTRLVQAMLFETSSFDPLVFGTGIGLVLLLAALASFVPARRAASIEPMEALRAE
jgi:putative ABC transport system permease protein